MSRDFSAEIDQKKEKVFCSGNEAGVSMIY